MRDLTTQIDKQSRLTMPEGRTPIPKGNARSSGYNRQADDWYQEPRRAVDALLEVEEFDGVIYEPACGGGNIPEACHARRLPVVGSDIRNRGWPHTILGDFLVPLWHARPPFNHIVTNPPFKLGVEFALRGLELTCGKVCILQRTVWLEGARRYQALFSKGHLMRVWQFRSRVSMPPGGTDVPAQGGSLSFAWFVFSRSHVGPWTGGWLP